MQPKKYKLDEGTEDVVSALGGREETAYCATTRYREKNYAFCTNTLQESDIMKAYVPSSILHVDYSRFSRLNTWKVMNDLRS